VEKQQTSVTL